MNEELVTPTQGAQRKKAFGSSIYGVAEFLDSLANTLDPVLETILNPQVAATPNEEDTGVNAGVLKDRSRAAMFNQGSQFTPMSAQKIYSIEELMIRNFFQNDRIGALGSGAGNGGRLEGNFDSNGFVVPRNGAQFVNRA